MRHNPLFWFLLLLLLSSFSSGYAAVRISGLNEAQYIYKAAEDSLSSYFYNETAIRLNYNNLEAGLSFVAELPKYDQFQAIKDLHHSDLHYRWDERYLQLNLSDYRLRAGSFSEYIGAGIMLRAFRDKAFDHDTRLTGLNIRTRKKAHQLKAFYGTLPNENNPGRNDLIGGLDYSTSFLIFSQLGFSLTSQQLRRFDDKYSTRLAAGSRMEIITDYFDLYTEYAESKAYRRIGDDLRGQAVYALANSYIGIFSLSAGYKKYDRFDDRMNDLPTLNASEEPLSERLRPGEDEEGLLGQIRYTPDFTTELSITYSEAWNSNFSIRQSDLFAEGRKDFETWILGLEYAQFETRDTEGDRQFWYKEITPAVLLDFDISSRPVHIRTEFGYREEVAEQTGLDFYKPLLQFDIFFNRFSVSLISEFEIKDLSSLDERQEWFGVEATASLFSHTEMKLFIGEERGGKVCRSGVCYYTTPFKGLRMDLTTRF